MQTPAWTKPALMGAAAGAVALTIVAFSAGWVVTAGTAEARAERQSVSAVVATLTPICVAQYKEMSATPAMLASLEKESSWKRGEFVRDQGWATMPGSDEPNSKVADACATELMKLTAN